VVDLLRQYDPEFDPAAWPQVAVEVEARCDRTAWGDGLRLVGAIGALGDWDPGRALALDGAAWPLWRGQLSLPAGLRVAHKLVVVTAAGAAVWEPGPDRLFTVPTEGDQVALELDFRP
jgi:hypothetical protein